MAFGVQWSHTCKSEIRPLFPNLPYTTAFPTGGELKMDNHRNSCTKKSSAFDLQCGRNVAAQRGRFPIKVSSHSILTTLGIPSSDPPPPPPPLAPDEDAMLPAYLQYPWFSQPVLTQNYFIWFNTDPVRMLVALQTESEAMVLEYTSRCQWVDTKHQTLLDQPNSSECALMPVGGITDAPTLLWQQSHSRSCCDEVPWQLVLSIVLSDYGTDTNHCRGSEKSTYHHFPEMILFWVVEFSARKTFPIILKTCLRESWDRERNPRYPVLPPTPSELGDILVQSRRSRKFLDFLRFLSIFWVIMDPHRLFEYFDDFWWFLMILETKIMFFNGIHVFF